MTYFLCVFGHLAVVALMNFQILRVSKNYQKLRLKYPENPNRPTYS